MGYELYIVRRSNWDNHKEQSNIALDEWLSYALSDVELKQNPKEGEGFFEWIAYPDPSMGVPWFNYYQGHISTKNPNYPVFEKLFLIAEALNAKVFDEDGEEFDRSILESLG